LTYIKPFFERLGFVEVDRALMPQKVWGECYDCPKFPNCDEVAVVKDAPFLEEGKRGIGELGN
jgi:amino-acid N-acetyltransferase